MASIGTLIAHIGADTTDFVRGIRQTETHMKNFDRNSVANLRRIGDGFANVTKSVFNLRNGLIALGGVAVIAKFTKDFIQASIEQEKAVAGMETALKSMGRYTPKLSAELQGVASSLQKVTNFGDEATIQGQKFLITYRGITDDLLPRSSKAMLDLAALMGGDTVRAANMLGKASMGMTGELRRAGITVDNNTFQLKGYAGVLEQIEEQVRGQAEAMRRASGPWIALRNVIGDVKEVMGKLLGTKINVWGETVLSYLWGISKSFQDNNGQMREFAESISVMFVEGLTVVGKGVGYLAKAFAGLPVIWASLKLAWLKFVELIQEGTAKIINVTLKVMESVNFRGWLDDEIEGIKKVQREQRQVLSGTKESLDAVMKSGSDALTTYEKIAVGVEKWNELLAEARKRALEAGKATKEAVQGDSWGNYMPMAFGGQRDFAIAMPWSDTPPWGAKAEETGKILENTEKSAAKVTKEIKKSQKATNTLVKNVKDVGTSFKPVYKLTADNLSLVKNTNKTIDSRLSLISQEKQKIESTLIPLSKRLEIENRIAEAQAWAQSESRESIERTSKRHEEAASKMERLWEHTMENVQDATADALYNAFDKGFDAFKDFTDSMKDLFKRTLAEIVAQAASQQIIIPILTQTIGSVLPGLFPAMAGTGGGGLDLLGASIFGLKGTIGQGLGAGLLGSLAYTSLGSAIGLPQGKYSGIGAGLGAGIGNMILPGAGGIIGGLLGGFGGSLFGSGYDDADVALILGAKGTGSEYANLPSSRYNFSSQAKDFGGGTESQINNAVVDYFNQLFDTLDAQFGVAVNSFLGNDLSVIHFNKAEKIVKGEGGIQRLLEMYTDRFLDIYGGALTTAIKGSVSRMLPGVPLGTDVLGDIGSIANTEDLNKVLTSISERVNAIKSITGAIDDFLTTSNMNDAQKAVWSINKSYKEYRDTLQALGVDVTKYVKLEQWKQAQLNQIMKTAQENAQTQIDNLVEQQKQIRLRLTEEKGSVLGSIEDMVRELRSGQFAPVQSVESFESKINDLFTAAKSGSQQDIQTLLSYIPDYLDFMSGMGDMQFINERIAQRLEELKPAVEINYQQRLIDETKGIQEELIKIQEELRKVRSAINNAGGTGNVSGSSTSNNSYANTSSGTAKVGHEMIGNAYKIHTDYLKKVEQEYGMAYVDKWFGPKGEYYLQYPGTKTHMRNAFKELYGYEKGGLATQLSVVGEKGSEWVLPTYEPERSSFLQAAGIDPEAIGRAMARALIEATGDNKERIRIVTLDGRVLADVMADQADTNGRFVRRLRNAIGSK